MNGERGKEERKKGDRRAKSGGEREGRDTVEGGERERVGGKRKGRGRKSREINDHGIPFR